MSGKLRVAVFGQTGRGNYGHALDTAWLDLADAEIVAVADTDASGLKAAAKRLGTESTFADYQELLNQVQPDVVAICPRWVDLHHAMAIASASVGAHFLIEKPFCRTPAEADEILDACRRHRVHFKVAHPTRFSPRMQTVRDLIADGAIGDVLEFRGRGKEDSRGGMQDLWVLGSHVLDMIHAISGRPDWCEGTILQQGHPVRASDIADGAEGLGLMAGDELHAMFGWDNGPVAWFDSRRSMAGSPSRYGLQIFGSKGVIEILESPLPSVMILQDPGWSAGRTGKDWKPVSSAGIDVPEPLKDPVYRTRHGLAIQKLQELIGQEGDFQTHADELAARDVIEMITAVAESHRQGQPVRFPLVQRSNPFSLMQSER